MIRIGSRGSDLALWQAHFFQDALKAVDINSEIIVIKTQGDKIQNLGFDKLEGKGFFTKELEDALLSGSIDVAVHSLKDLPTNSVEGLLVAGLSYRADARDTILFNQNSQYPSIKHLHAGTPIIGTSSLRRKSQLKGLFPNARMKDIRGNVPTRISKLESGDFDAIILAKAGIDRLEIDVSQYQAFHFDVSELVPAPGQGVLGYQTTVENIEMRRILNKLHHTDVAYCTNIERGVLNALDGGCQLPLGVYAYKDSNGNYISHTSFADKNDKLHQFKISQSTFDGLKDTILTQLKDVI